MSKRIKDSKVSLSVNSIEPGTDWLAHDISSTGEHILLRSSQKFILGEIQADGHSIYKIISPKDIRWISFCNFLPDGNILLGGVKGNDDLNYPTLDDFEDDFEDEEDDFEDEEEEDRLSTGRYKFVWMKLECRSLRNLNEREFYPFSEILTSTNAEEITSIDYNEMKIDFLKGDGRTKVELKYRDKESIPDQFEMRFYRKNYPDQRISFYIQSDLSSISVNKNIVLFDSSRKAIELIERSQINPPKYDPDRNWRRNAKLVNYTIGEGIHRDSIALLFTAGRKIFISKRISISGPPSSSEISAISVNLNFGQSFESPAETYGSGYETYGASEYFCMKFNEDASRLHVLSNLPYGTLEEDEYEGVREWCMHSFDVDGRFREIERTQLRKEGKYKLQAERKKRTDTLANAGLPYHIAKLISLNKISDKEGIELFRYLRSSGAPNENVNKLDTLESIDQMAFSGRFSKEDAKWLIENRNHGELVKQIMDGEFSIERAKELLITLGFADHPEAVVRVVEGAEIETVAMIFGIDTDNNPRIHEEVEEPTEEPNQKQAKTESKKRGFFRRKGRFS